MGIALVVLVSAAVAGWYLALYFGRNLAQVREHEHELQMEMLLHRASAEELAEELEAYRRTVAKQNRIIAEVANENAYHFDMHGVDQSFVPYVAEVVEGDRAMIWAKN